MVVSASSCAAKQPESSLTGRRGKEGEEVRRLERRRAKRTLGAALIYRRMFTGKIGDDRQSTRRAHKDRETATAARQGLCSERHPPKPTGPSVLLPFSSSEFSF
ncbi:hypothetical protein BHE74_00027183 [Ensete ventricosum]|nr:hypothetical protein BHE74_00027183 [Ensete ventricosum]